MKHTELTTEIKKQFTGFKFPSVQDEYQHLLDDGYQSIITGIPKEELEKAFPNIIQVEMHHYLTKTK